MAKRLFRLRPPKPKPAKASKPTRSSGTFIQRSRSVGAGQKAAWHQVEGAGKSHVLRPFLGLSDADADAIAKRLDQGLDEQLAKVR